MKYLFLILFLVSCESKLEQNKRLVEEVKICIDAGLDYQFYADGLNHVYATCNKPSGE
jgi:hypothetical protein